MPLHESHARPNGPIPQAVPLTNPVATADGGECKISIADIDPDPEQPRKEFDAERDEELKANMHDHGLLYAIIVFLVLATRRYQIVDGERRWRAAKALGWTTIRARVLEEPPDDNKLRELRLTGNEQRQNLSEIERGLAYHEFLTNTGCTASALARKVGRSVSYVTRCVNLLKKFPDDVRELIRCGKLPPGVARELTGLPDDAKRHFARLYIEGKITSGEELAAAIKAARNGPAGSGTSGFSCEESGIRIAISWTNGSSDVLTNVENALRVVLKDLAGQKQRGVEHWKHFLETKAKAAKKAADLAEAQKALAQVANPLPERRTTNG